MLERFFLPLLRFGENASFEIWILFRQQVKYGNLAHCMDFTSPSSTAGLEMMTEEESASETMGFLPKQEEK
jgi:hypothetical protein